MSRAVEEGRGPARSVAVALGLRGELGGEVEGHGGSEEPRSRGGPPSSGETHRLWVSPSVCGHVPLRLVQRGVFRLGSSC